MTLSSSALASNRLHFSSLFKSRVRLLFDHNSSTTTDKTGKTLNQVWTSPEDGEVASAYLGIALPNYPNLFCTYGKQPFFHKLTLIPGPNTNLGHNSIVFMIETQVHYITELISTMNKNKIKALTVKPEVMKTYYEGKFS